MMVSMQTTFYYQLKTCKIKQPKQQPKEDVRTMYEMIVDLTKKYNELDKKCNDLEKKCNDLEKKYNHQKKYHPPHRQSLETYRKEELNIDIFEFIHSQFIVQLEDVQYLFHKTFLQTFERILSRIDFSSSFVCNSSKPFHIYGFFQEQQQWKELNNDILVSLFNKCKRIFFSSAYEHKLQNQSKIEHNEKMEELFDNLLNKITSVELSNKHTFNKFKHLFLNHLEKENI